MDDLDRVIGDLQDELKRIYRDIERQCKSADNVKKQYHDAQLKLDALLIDVCSAYLEKISDPPQVGHEWIWEPGKIPKCPCCGAYSEDGDMGATWCGFCGAKMDGGNEHAADCCG